MIITALVENTTKSELKAKHGLSLYIETQKHKMLFDLGPIVRCLTMRRNVVLTFQRLTQLLFLTDI